MPRINPVLDATEIVREHLYYDRKVQNVSETSAFRHADAKRGWTDCGYFTLLMDGVMYMVSVEPVDVKE